MSSSWCYLAPVQSRSGPCQNQGMTGSGDALPAAPTPGQGDVIPVLHSSLDTERASVWGKISVSCCLWFQLTCCIYMLRTGFELKTILGTYVDRSTPDNDLLSQKFPNKAATVGRCLQSNLCNAFLKKCLKIMWETQTEEIWETQHYTSQFSVSSQNLMFHFQHNDIIFWSIH